MLRFLTLSLLLAACADVREEPLPAAWSSVGDTQVTEPVRFTDQPYTDLPGTVGALAEDFFPTTDVEYAPGDGYPDGSSCGGRENRDLPLEIEGIVTLHPRWYMKIDGCNRGEEKYYGNWFIEDSAGGIFVIGDSKVAHFDMGDRVKLRVRAIRTNFGMDMIYAHDVTEVYREARPIYYQWAQDGIGADDIGETRRVRGVVETDPDDFGQFTVRTDEGAAVFVNLDAELNRRRTQPPLGATVCATGPVNYSFSEYSIVIMRVGQITVLTDGESCPD
jgi:hypothetical protein